MNLDAWLAGPGKPVVEAIKDALDPERYGDRDELAVVALRAALSFAPTCETCHGTGYLLDPRTDPPPPMCDTCNGSGKSLPLLTVNEREEQ